MEDNNICITIKNILEEHSIDELESILNINDEQLLDYCLNNKLLYNEVVKIFSDVDFFLRIYGTLITTDRLIEIISSRKTYATNIIISQYMPYQLNGKSLYQELISEIKNKDEETYNFIITQECHIIYNLYTSKVLENKNLFNLFDNLKLSEISPESIIEFFKRHNKNIDEDKLISNFEPLEYCINIKAYNVISAILQRKKGYSYGNTGISSLFYALYKFHKKYPKEFNEYFKYEQDLGIINMMQVLVVNGYTKDIKVSKKYSTTIFKEYDKDIELKEKYNEELKRLNVLLNDGNSDSILVNGILKSYKYLLDTEEHELFYRELKTLIRIKEEHPNFKIIYYDNGCSCFDKQVDTIFIDKYQTGGLIDTINHELAHAIHYYLANYDEPVIFRRKIEELKENGLSTKLPEVREKNDITVKEVNKEATRLVKNDPSSLPLLTRLRQLPKQYEYLKYIFEDYTDEELKEVLSLYDEQLYQIRVNELESRIIADNFNNIMAVEDILDAIYEGKLYEEAQMQYGHGKQYYTSQDNIFIEILAEYVQILKSKDSKKYILELKTILGDELVDIIDDFYREQILYLEFKDEINPGERKK